MALSVPLGRLLLRELLLLPAVAIVAPRCCNGPTRSAAADADDRRRIVAIVAHHRIYVYLMIYILATCTSNCLVSSHSIDATVFEKVHVASR